MSTTAVTQEEKNFIASLSSPSVLHPIESADCCTNPNCDKLISSERQIKHKGTQICDECAQIDAHEEER